MANTTFSGPVRSENGFQNISINQTTGAVTVGPQITSAGVVAAPVSLADANTTLTTATNAGRVNIVGDNTGNRTYLLPAPVAGAYFQFVYGGGAADASNFIISTGSDTNYFIGGLTFLDSDAGAGSDEISVVYSDGNSNSKLTVVTPGACQVNILAKDSTNWQIWGTVTSVTVPAFADQ